MKYTVTITVSPESEHNEKFLRSEACTELKKQQIVLPVSDITFFICRKKSVDARRGKVKLHMRYDVYTGTDTPVTDNETFIPSWKQANPKKRVLIIGNGPAGLFAALSLLEHGIMPVIIERGPETAIRKHDIAAISKNGTVANDSNYCFGEGGAGTFSDGKLYSRSNKRGDIGRILRIFHYHGADAAILQNAHPHIGSDKLPSIINAMNETVRKYGGEIHFNTRCTGIITESVETGIRAVGITALSLPENIPVEFRADAVILAGGHSAADIYEMIAAISPMALEAKTFAVGLRVEHPRACIDRIQYHGSADVTNFPAAEYRLTAQVDGRGVYSFCMCPGGLVVPSASSGGSIVVNGMSPSGRNSNWSNAAIVVEIKPEDIPAEFTDSECPALAGLRFRSAIEKAAYAAAQNATQTSGTVNPQTAPAQLLTDFLDSQLSKSLPRSSYTPGLVSVRLDQVLPEYITSRLKKAFVEYNKNMRGFISPEALLIAPETRTSTPVRILRNPETRESPVIAGLYPTGEGSGYAGGIVSSAMDGEATALLLRTCIK